MPPFGGGVAAYCRKTQRVVHVVGSGGGACAEFSGSIALSLAFRRLRLLVAVHDTWWRVAAQFPDGGEQAILQGTGGFRRLAKAAASGTAAGLAISIPMFRWLGDMSVALSFLVYSLSILFFLFVYRDRSIPWRVAGRKSLERVPVLSDWGGILPLPRS